MKIIYKMFWLIKVYGSISLVLYFSMVAFHWSFDGEKWGSEARGFAAIVWLIINCVVTGAILTGNFKPKETNQQ